jgi:hypothetical protein
MRDDTADQIFEEFQEIVQQAILRDFPNPERKGCPRTEVLRELADRPRPTRDAAWEHVTHCSPCYREFLDLRSQVKARLELQRRQTLQRRAALAASVALVTGAGVVAYEIFHHAQVVTSPEANAYEPALLDLRNQSAPRSSGTPNTSVAPPILPAKRLKLRILLPIGSEPGHYEVEFLNSTAQLVKTGGEAYVQQGTTILMLSLDLRGRAGRNYEIGLRRPPSDWVYYRIMLQ